MGKVFESVLFKGLTDRTLRVTYVFELLIDGPFKNIKEDEETGKITTYPAYMITLSTLNPRIRFAISSNKYYTFVVLFEKSLKLIQENLFELFPNVGKIEFDMDDSVLERFQKEKALSSAGITIVPAIYTDGTGGCFPGMRLSFENKDGSITIPLEDAISIDRMFRTFDPNQYGMSILSQLIKIE